MKQRVILHGWELKDKNKLSNGVVCQLSLGKSEGWIIMTSSMFMVKGMKQTEYKDIQNTVTYTKARA